MPKEAPDHPAPDNNEPSRSGSTASIEEGSRSATATTVGGSLSEQSTLNEENDRSEGSSTTKDADQAPTVSRLPSHSPLAFSNYPPLYDPNRPSATIPRSKQARAQSQSGMPVEQIAAVLSTKSASDSKTSQGKFDDAKDRSSRHGRLADSNREAYTRGRLNIFGRDVGGLGLSSRFRKK